MKTKHLLFSTVLAVAAFSACTNEDFVENTPGVDLGGEKVNISILASKGADEAATRIGLDPNENGSLSGAKPYWENDDMLGGLLFTAADGSAMLTNYPFKPSETIEEGEKPTAVTFTTPTAVSKGLYVFYTPYAKKHVSNGTFTTTLADRQEMDPANPTAHLMANDFMISPTVSLAGIEYEAENELPIRFKSIYNYVRINITLKEATEPVTIQRIVFKNATSGGSFATTAQIVPSKLRTLQGGATGNWSDGKDKAGSTTILTVDNDLDAEKAVASDYSKAAGTFEVSDATKLVTQSGTTSAIVLSIKGGKELKAGESFNAYVLLPHGTYTDGISYDIYSDKGVSEQILKPTSGSLELKAGRTSSASCTVNFTINNNDFEVPETFDIASDQDWKDAVAYVTENYSIYGSTTSWNTPTFNLLKDVKGTLPNFAIDVTGTSKLTLTGENTLNGTIAYGLTSANIANEGTLTVAAKPAPATTYTVNSLANSGTVTVNGDLTITTTLTNTGTFVNAGKTTVTTTTTNGDATKKPAAVLTNTGTFIATQALTNCEGATINVNNTAASTGFTLSAASTNSKGANINIASGATLMASTAALTNAGTITLNDAAVLAGGTTLDNGKAADNDEGTIVITDASKNYQLTVPASGQNGIIKTTVSTLAGIEAAQKKVAGTANNLINTIELTSSIKVDDDLDLDGVNLSLAKDVKLEIENAKTVTCENLVVAGAGASVAPYSADGSVDEPAATLATKTVDVKDGASFTISKDVAVGVASTSEVTALTVGKASSLTNNGSIVGDDAGTTPITVNVAAGGSLVNSAEGTVTGKLEIESNNGKISNSSKTAIKVVGSMAGSMEGNFSFNS